MAYRILIADDEEKIVRLIQKLGNWDALNIEIVATCHDGQETFRSIQQLQPDIVLTDIKMPIHDGIELIEMTQTAGYNVHFIVLSGYKHFEYAHSAIRLGVVDYLLKPLDADQLNLALEKACRLIDARLKKERDGQELESYHRQSRDDLNNQLRDMLLSYDYIDQLPQTNEELNRLYHTDFSYGLYRCLLLTTNLSMLLDSSQSLFLEQLHQIAPKILGNDCRYTILPSKAWILILLNYGKEQREAVRQKITALFYSLKNQVEVYGEFALNIGVSSEKEKIRDLACATEEAHTAEWAHLVLSGVKVLEYDHIKSLPRFSVRDLLTQRDEEALTEASRLFRRDLIGQIFSRLGHQAENYRNHHPEDIAHFLQHLVRAVVDVHIREDNSLLKDIFDDLYIHNKNSRSFPDEIRVLYLYLDGWLSKRLEEIQAEIGKPIDEAKQYLELHFAEALSLTVVAEQVHLSSAYFSKLFKSETGTGFAEYLADLRIRKGQELLLRTDLGIREVSEKVGYPDDKYFCRLFKKQVGIRPSEYRKLYKGR